MRRLIPAGLLLLLASPPAPGSNARIDRYVRAEMELNGIPGLSLVIVEDGAVSYVEAYGVRSTASGKALTVDTPVELASVSKSLTALAVLRLEREGHLDRNSAAAVYLPELKRASWREVTVRHLLQHRSGLRRGHDFQVPCCGQAGEFNLRLAVETLAPADLKSPSGEAFSYANSNYVLLAAIVERASALSFPDYMRERVFRPLGMNRTTVDDAQARSWGRADPHEWQWGRVRVSSSPFFGWYGASLVKSSAGDMGKYITFLLDPAGAETPIVPLGWWEQLERGYDLGWFVQTEAWWLNGDFALEHVGDIWGANTAVVLAPRQRAGVAVLTNLGTNRANRIGRAILRHLGGSELPQPIRMNRTEIPDSWAIAFVVSSAILLTAMLAYGLRVRRQVRRRRRTWKPNGWRVARAALLASMAIAVIYTAFGGLGPPLVTFPTTVKVALPLLVLSVAGLMLFAAVVGLTPKRRT